MVASAAPFRQASRRPDAAVGRRDQLVLNRAPMRHGRYDLDPSTLGAEARRRHQRGRVLHRNCCSRPTDGLVCSYRSTSAWAQSRVLDGRW
jgi:hypothetical protein